MFEAGALDVVFCPIQMKKNRPGILIQVMGRPEQRDVLMDILFTESTTLGIRFQYTQRKVLQRSMVEIDSPWGKMMVKTQEMTERRRVCEMATKSIQMHEGLFQIHPQCARVRKTFEDVFFCTIEQSYPECPYGRWVNVTHKLVPED